MSETAAASVDYVLPATLMGHADLARLLREVESVDGELQAQKVHDSSAAVRLPPLSQGLSDFLEQNDLNVADGQALMELKERLRKLKDHAPVVHMTFAADADPYSLQKLVAWLRQEIHPHTLVAIGMQPSLVGGVYLRTPNHVHDFSVKAMLKDKSCSIIASELEKFSAR